MSLTLELPPTINEEIVLESQREGVSEAEHAALLICLASALTQEEPNTHFQKAVRDFLSKHSLDADRVSSVFEELVHVCLDTHDLGKMTTNFQETFANSSAQIDSDPLKHWRHSVVHETFAEHFLDINRDRMLSYNPPSDESERAQGRMHRETASDKEIGDPREHVLALLAKWQAADGTLLRPDIPTLPGETQGQALFRKWAVEDANMTDEEKDAEDRMWEDIEKSILANRTNFRTMDEDSW